MGSLGHWIIGSFLHSYPALTPPAIGARPLGHTIFGSSDHWVIATKRTSGSLGPWAIRSLGHRVLFSIVLPAEPSRHRRHATGSDPSVIGSLEHSLILLLFPNAVASCRRRRTTGSFSHSVIGPFGHRETTHICHSVARPRSPRARRQVVEHRLRNTFLQCVLPSNGARV